MRNLLGFVLITALAISSCKKPSNRPNIILIMTDDQGWFDAGFNGNSEIHTPWLDKLASGGVIFDRFYSASAVCSPTRASLITGRNPLRIDIPYANEGHMKAEEITIAEILRKAGYTSGHFGKWHLGTFTKDIPDANRGGKPEFDPDYSIPTEHGYSTFFCTESKVPTFDPMTYPNTFTEGESMRYGWRAIQDSDSAKSYGTAYWKGENQVETDNTKGDDSRIIMDRVIPFIEKSLNGKQPFFSTIWFHTPHLPVVCDSTHRSIYKDLDLPKQLYYGTITAMDEQIGRLWKQLEKYGIEDETIIFFCSDNGPENGTPGSAGEFRDRKRSLYEGGVRVPAFAIWKNTFMEGSRIDFPIVSSDYMPTILDILDIDYPDSRPIDGISILEAINGKNPVRNEPIGFICAPSISWVSHKYKLIRPNEEQDFELYDLLNDKYEKQNIIEEYPDLARQLENNLSEWLRSVEKSKKGLDYN